MLTEIIMFFLQIYENYIVKKWVLAQMQLITNLFFLIFNVLKNYFF